MRPRTLDLPDRRVWLRVADPDWSEPLDPSFAEREGGRWNPPGAFRALYLNADVATARARIEAMLEGQPVEIDDLDDDAYVLVAVTLPRDQTCAEAVSEIGLEALGLPAAYPLDVDGRPVPWSMCQPIGAAIRRRRLRGVVCHSAATRDGRGRELAWFPATRRSRAHPLWARARDLGEWRAAVSWLDLGLAAQPDVPAP